MGEDPKVHDSISLETAFRLIDKDKPAPLACCPRDGEPLISTFEMRGAEFHCLACGEWFGFLAPKPMDPTPELMERYETAKRLFDGGIRGPHDLSETSG